MGTPFARAVTEDRRLVILRLLAESGGYKANDSVLQSGLRAIGHDCSRDQVRADLSWLESTGLVVLSWVIEGALVVAVLTDQGFDAQSGRVAVPGVKRPSPRSL